MTLNTTNKNQLLVLDTVLNCNIVIDLLIKIHLNNSPHKKKYYVREVSEK